jgi:hypothetical protein
VPYGTSDEQTSAVNPSISAAHANEPSSRTQLNERTIITHTAEQTNERTNRQRAREKSSTWQVQRCSNRVGLAMPSYHARTRCTDPGPLFCEGSFVQPQLVLQLLNNTLQLSKVLLQLPRAVALLLTGRLAPLGVVHLSNHTLHAPRNTTQYPPSIHPPQHHHKVCLL